MTEGGPLELGCKWHLSFLVVLEIFGAPEGQSQQFLAAHQLTGLLKCHLEYQFVSVEVNDFPDDPLFIKHLILVLAIH